jgi:hypothetical protein
MGKASFDPQGIQLMTDVPAELERAGYSIVTADRFSLSAGTRHAFDAMLSDFEDLERDAYLPDGGSYRFRRHARFRFDPGTGELSLLPHSSYFQDYATNRFVGGVERLFSPIRPETTRNEFLLGITRLNILMLPPRGRSCWVADVHLVRIVGTPDQPGKPAPEGIHNDGFDFVSFHLISREGVMGGESVIYDPEKRPLARRTLESPLDSFYADDRRVLHFTSPIRPRGGQRAHRDMLLMSYRREDGTPSP